jgi:CRISPR/Cas system CSM-associated protein Csm5 (group 7 of RAMP superfamily)
LPGIRHLDLEFLNQPEPGKLWDILNEFSKASVETDRDILDSHAGILENDEIAREVYDSLVDFFEHLSGNIGKEIKTAHMRLGFGKTYFDNSLGLAIYRESPEIFMKYVKLFRLGKPRQTEFPVTRTVCTEPLVPMGWVTLKY